MTLAPETAHDRAANAVLVLEHKPARAFSTRLTRIGRYGIFPRRHIEPVTDVRLFRNRGRARVSTSKLGPVALALERIPRQMNATTTFFCMKSVPIHQDAGQP